MEAWTNLVVPWPTIGAWLSRILSNPCLMRLRKARHAQMTSLDEVSTLAPVRLEVIDHVALPEQLVGDDEVIRVVNKEIRVSPSAAGSTDQARSTPTRHTRHRGGLGNQPGRCQVQIDACAN